MLVFACVALMAVVGVSVVDTNQYGLSPPFQDVNLWGSARAEPEAPL